MTQHLISKTNSLFCAEERND